MIFFINYELKESGCVLLSTIFQTVDQRKLEKAEAKIRAKQERREGCDVPSALLTATLQVDEIVLNATIACYRQIPSHLCAQFVSIFLTGSFHRYAVLFDKTSAKYITPTISILML